MTKETKETKETTEPERELHILNSRCFACGPGNPRGLHMRFFAEGSSVVSRLRVPDELCGWSRLVHGGVVATILDEIMSWAAIYLLKRVILTKSMTVDFIQAIHPDAPLKAEGRLQSLDGKREAVMEGFLYLGEDKLCAKATGTFTLLKPEMVKRLRFLDSGILDDMEPLLRI